MMTLSRILKGHTVLNGKEELSMQEFFCSICWDTHFVEASLSGREVIGGFHNGDLVLEAFTWMELNLYYFIIYHLYY